MSWIVRSGMAARRYSEDSMDDGDWSSSSTDCSGDTQIFISHVDLEIRVASPCQADVKLLDYSEELVCYSIFVLIDEEELPSVSVMIPL